MIFPVFKRNYIHHTSGSCFDQFKRAGHVFHKQIDSIYGTSILDILSNYKLPYNTTATANQLEEQMLNRHFGSFQSYNGFGLTYTEYGPVENSNWDILVTVNFWPVFLSMLPSAGFAVLGMLLIMAVLYYFVNRHASCSPKP